MTTIIEFGTVLISIWLPCNIVLLAKLSEMGKLKIRHRVETAMNVVFFFAAIYYWVVVAESPGFLGMFFWMIGILDLLGLILLGFYLLHKKEVDLSSF